MKSPFKLEALLHLRLQQEKDAILRHATAVKKLNLIQQKQRELEKIFQLQSMSSSLASLNLQHQQAFFISEWAQLNQAFEQASAAVHQVRLAADKARQNREILEKLKEKVILADKIKQMHHEEKLLEDNWNFKR